MARHFNHRQKSTLCSSQDPPFAYNESLQHPTIAVLLMKIPFFFLFFLFDYLVVFTCSKVINVNAFKR